MVSFLVRRLLYSLLILLAVSFIAFVGVRATFDPLAKFAQSKDVEAKQREKVRLAWTSRSSSSTEASWASSSPATGE